MGDRYNHGGTMTAAGNHLSLEIRLLDLEDEYMDSDGTLKPFDSPLKQSRKYIAREFSQVLRQSNIG